MKGLLEGKTVLVSGAGEGLGREVAEAAVRDGANVVLAARREPILRQTAEALGPDRVAWAVTDITDPAGVAAFVDVAVQRFGRIDALVNCAAFDASFGGLGDADFATWRTTFEVNFFGTMAVTRAALPHLVATQGSIVIIGSQTVWDPTMPQVAYAASKGALLSAVTHLVKELGPQGVRINSVLPGWMWGPPVQAYVRWTAKLEKRPEDEVLAELTARMPLGRLATDGDVAEAVIFLACDRARGITGQSLLVNAGQISR